MIGAAPLGLVTGYVVAAITITSEVEWIWAFGAKIALLAILALII